MLRQIKTLGLGLLLSSSLIAAGCSNIDELTTTLTNMETKYYEIHDNMDEASETLDPVIIKEAIEDFESLQEEIETEQANYEKDETEYKMFDEFNRTISYKIEGCELVLYTTDNILAAALDPTLEDKLNTITEGMDKAWEAYENYKKELGIVTTPIKSTVSKEEATVEEKEEVKQEKETEKEYVKKETVDPDKYQGKCNRCGKETILDNETGMCDNCKDYGQCYDCGEYKLINNMTFNGRSYHCGCAEETVTYSCVECGAEIVLDADADAMDLCNDCINKAEQTRQCDQCFNLININEMQEIDGCYYCATCIANGAGTYPCDYCGKAVYYGTMCECEASQY